MFIVPNTTHINHHNQPQLAPDFTCSREIIAANRYLLLFLRTLF